MYLPPHREKAAAEAAMRERIRQRKEELERKRAEEEARRMEEYAREEREAAAAAEAMRQRIEQRRAELEKKRQEQEQAKMEAYLKEERYFFLFPRHPTNTTSFLPNTCLFRERQAAEEAMKARIEARKQELAKKREAEEKAKMEAYLREQQVR